MFADSFCDSGWSNRSHRGWTTLVSFALQALAVGCLLLLPLLYTQGLPRLAVARAAAGACSAAGGSAGAATSQSGFGCPKQHDGNQAGQSSSRFHKA